MHVAPIAPGGPPRAKRRSPLSDTAQPYEPSLAQRQPSGVQLTRKGERYAAQHAAPPAPEIRNDSRIPALSIRAAIEDLLRIRDEAADMAAWLIDEIDEIDGGDLDAEPIAEREPDDDEEPSLGSVLCIDERGYGPDVGHSGNHRSQAHWAAGAADDLEDEHDGREPDEADQEPSLAIPEGGQWPSGGDKDAEEELTSTPREEADGRYAQTRTGNRSAEDDTDPEHEHDVADWDAMSDPTLGLDLRASFDGSGTRVAQRLLTERRLFPEPRRPQRFVTAPDGSTVMVSGRV